MRNLAYHQLKTQTFANDKHKNLFKILFHFPGE